MLFSTFWGSDKWKRKPWECDVLKSWMTITFVTIVMSHPAISDWLCWVYKMVSNWVMSVKFYLWVKSRLLWVTHSGGQMLLQNKLETNTFWGGATSRVQYTGEDHSLQLFPQNWQKNTYTTVRKWKGAALSAMNTGLITSTTQNRTFIQTKLTKLIIYSQNYRQ